MLKYYTIFRYNTVKGEILFKMNSKLIIVESNFRLTYILRYFLKHLM